MDLKEDVKVSYDRGVQNAFNVYKPSFESLDFLSEEGRTCKAESLITENLDHYDDLRLASLARNILSKFFGRNDESALKALNDYDHIVLGEHYDTVMPLAQIIDYDVNKYIFFRI